MFILIVFIVFIYDLSPVPEREVGIQIAVVHIIWMPGGRAEGRNLQVWIRRCAMVLIGRYAVVLGLVGRTPIDLTRHFLNVRCCL
jgi:hypothetical protein